MKRIAIVQSNYIPWKGYFDLIASVDEFVLFDDAQYTRRDWRNRNQIKTPQGLKWLTVPVGVKGNYFQTIRETEIQPGDWARQHWTALSLNYARAPAFKEVALWLAQLYERPADSHLSPLNRRFLQAIMDRFGIATVLRDSAEYSLSDGKSERLADICKQAGADIYVSGPAAHNYLDEKVFAQRGIIVEWFDYSGYPEYLQLWGDFTHQVSVLDLLFNCGDDWVKFMKVAGK